MAASYLPPSVPVRRDNESAGEFRSRTTRWAENIRLVWVTHLAYIIHAAHEGYFSPPNEKLVAETQSDMEWLTYLVERDPKNIRECGPQILSLFFRAADRDWGAQPMRAVPHFRVIQSNLGS